MCHSNKLTLQISKILLYISKNTLDKYKYVPSAVEYILVIFEQVIEETMEDLNVRQEGSHNNPKKRGNKIK